MRVLRCVCPADLSAWAAGYTVAGTTPILRVLKLLSLTFNRRTKTRQTNKLTNNIINNSDNSSEKRQIGYKLFLLKTRLHIVRSTAHVHEGQDDGRRKWVRPKHSYSRKHHLCAMLVCSCISSQSTEAKFSIRSDCLEELTPDKDYKVCND